MSRFTAQETYALFDSPANKRLLAEITSTGAKTILFPALETEAVNMSETEKLFGNLTSFDWLIFPDIYTVEFFLQKLEELSFDLFELDALRICAYGESVADRLRFVQLHADVIPNSIKTKDVWEALKNYLFDEIDFENLHFLILKKQAATIEILTELEKQNAVVKELVIYQTTAEETPEIAKSKALLRGGAIDEFIFTSPFDVINLAHLFPNENLANVLADVKLFPSDNLTSQSLQELRLL